MSQYGNPPHGAPPPPQPGWGPPPGQVYGAYPPPQYGYQYGGPGYGQPPVPFGGYASWGQRVLAMLWDIVVVLPALGVLFAGFALLAVGGAIGSGSAATGFIVLAIVVIIAGYAWAIWRQIKNIWIDQGRTGYTYGKRKVGIRVIREQDGQPMGVGVAVARWLLHSLLNSCLMLDYLWPLWDAKNQTLTDKVLTTIVVNQPPQQY